MVKGANGNEYKVNLCKGNVLCAGVIFPHEDSHEDARLNMFFIDLDHAKRCIASTEFGPFFRNCSDFVFYAKEMGKEERALVRLIKASGIEVTVIK